MDSQRNAANILQDDGKKSPSDGIIVFVLGGPGSGKSTQCSMISKHCGFCHLSASHLLDKKAQSRSEDGKMIKALKAEGKLVPSHVVINLLQQAMEESDNKKFLIDRFPRNEENRIAAEEINLNPDLVLYFECSEETMTKRILSRNQGRCDDNLATLRNRMKIFFEDSLPVIDYYSSQGKVYKIDAERSTERIFEEVKNVLGSKVGAAV